MVGRTLETRSNALKRIRTELEAAGIPDAWLDAELLLAHTLGSTRTGLYTSLEAPLTPDDVRRLQALLERRLKREPLAYILGYREFFSHRFLVTPATLVPRPETETLLEYALAWVYRRTALAAPPTIAADIGTGSGCLAISLALALPQVTVFATDTSPAALEVAKENNQTHKVANRVTFLQGSVLAPLPEPVDLIVANLPYVPEPEIAELEPEVRTYEPRDALTPGGDGTALNRLLLEQATTKLRPGGALFLEMHPLQSGALKEHAERCFPEGTVQILKDLAGLDRVLAVGLPPLPNLVCLV